MGIPLLNLVIGLIFSGLAQTENLSIIHGYDGSSFQKHYINQDSGYGFCCFFSFHLCLCCKCNLLMYVSLLVSAALSYQKITSIDYNAIILNQVLCLSFDLLVVLFLILFPENRYHWSRCLPVNFVFQSGFLNDIFDVLRYWKSHKYLQPNRWLQSWLRREIQALMQVLSSSCTNFLSW